MKKGRKELEGIADRETPQWATVGHPPTAERTTSPSKSFVPSCHQDGHNSLCTLVQGGLCVGLGCRRVPR
jgi:hypothetical protein